MAQQRQKAADWPPRPLSLCPATAVEAHSRVHRRPGLARKPGAAGGTQARHQPGSPSSWLARPSWRRQSSITPGAGGSTSRALEAGIQRAEDQPSARRSARSYSCAAQPPGAKAPGIGVRCSGPVATDGLIRRCEGGQIGNNSLVPRVSGGAKGCSCSRLRSPDPAAPATCSADRALEAGTSRLAGPSWPRRPRIAASRFNQSQLASDRCCRKQLG